MIQIAVVMSMIGVLMAPMGGFLGTKDCKKLRCIESGEQVAGFPQNTGTPSRPPRRGGRGPSGPSRPAPTTCTPRDPSPARPDVAAMPLPQGELIHSAGTGPVVVGMDTEFEWRGPQQVTWTQPSRPGRRADCTYVRGAPTRFTASLRTLVFEFEQGERIRYITDTGKVTHRYTTIPRDEGEEQFTVCVYAGYEIPGQGFATLQLVEELDHDVVEIRSTLIE
jgi:hypothetical protein